MDQDTDIGGANYRFPDTSHSAIIAAHSDSHELRRTGLDTIVTAYWKPVYKYLRLKFQLSNEDAKDLTQAFFVTLIEKDYLDSFNSTKGSFRTFLRTCLDRFAANQYKHGHRHKRGGDVQLMSLDFDVAEQELAQVAGSATMSPEEHFQREWVRSLFMLATETLREHYKSQNRAIYFQLFELYDLSDNSAGDRISYSSLAKQFSLTQQDVTNYLAAARRKFRQIVLDKLRELTASDEEFRAEARALLGWTKT
jgi:RNA polymerase sigma factor (sigma-70 family)